MNPRYLGDSYDIVKQSLLRVLAAEGSWATHPMFTDPVSPERLSCYRRLLGTPILSDEVLTSGVDRDAYLAPARDGREHVFLDPDTGIRLRSTRGKKAPQYIFGSELMEIAKVRQGRLTLVYDQSLARGAEGQQLQNKLSWFTTEDVYGVAYVSHACFVLLGTDRSMVKGAFELLKKETGLPEYRFLEAL
jgi:hypothetical protein